MMRWLRALGLSGSLALAEVAGACTCLGVENYLEPAVLEDLFRKADVIVHARVTGLRSEHEARIEVIEAFKGRPATLKALRRDGAACGTSFRAGEEALYIAFDGRINLCGRLAPREDLLRRLREFRR